MTTFKAVADALSSDAHRWEEVAAVLTHQSSNAASMNLEPDALPDFFGVPATYAQVQAKIEALLGEGGYEAANISNTLLWVRERFTSNDEAVRDSLRGLWDARGLQ